MGNRTMGLTILFAILTIALPDYSLAENKGDKVTVRISAPSDGAKVGERPFIEGTVSDPDAEVWVVVHPTAVTDYWVQPAVTVKENGKWKVQVHIGRPGRDIGKHFEIRAFANPEGELTNGLKLAKWPKAEAKSNLIEVIRQ